MSFLPAQLSSAWVLWAAVLFLLKHYIADFLLQTDWIARGKESETGWFWPLTAHAGIHGLFTAAIFAYAAPGLAWLGLVDFAVHFAIDKAKSEIGRPFHLDPSGGGFWWLLGLDQTLHHATHLLFVLVIAAANSPG